MVIHHSSHQLGITLCGGLLPLDVLFHHFFWSKLKDLLYWLSSLLQGLSLFCVCLEASQLNTSREIYLLHAA